MVSALTPARAAASPIRNVPSPIGPSYTLEPFQVQDIIPLDPRTAPYSTMSNKESHHHEPVDRARRRRPRRGAAASHDARRHVARGAPETDGKGRRIEE